MYPGDFMFSVVPIFIGVIFIIVIGAIIFNVGKGITQWQKNEASPRLTVPAIVKTKRTHTSRHTHNHGDHHSHSTHSHYYVTFEYESGDRSEFKVSGKEYGLLAEGDMGKLSFQGTRFLGFERFSK